MIQKEMQVTIKCKFEVMRLRSQWKPDVLTLAGHRRAQQIRERAEHESSGHAVYRSWCEECIKATGMSHQHRRIDHSEDLVDTVTMDYYYMGEEDGAKPYLVAQDRRTGMMMSTS